MQDRVPLYPGRVKLTPVSGQENTYDMVRSDQPTQEGTKVNKATLFDAAAEKAIFNNANGNHTPAEAFAALPNLFEPVGTIKTTVRTDLGNKWLLCNGAIVDPATYPDLCEVLPAADPGGTWSSADTEFSSYYSYAYFGSANGLFFKIYTDGSTSPVTIKLKYSSSPDGPWTSVDIKGDSNNSYYIRNIKYINGYYIICAYKMYSGYACLIYSNSLSGTWTIKYLGSASSNNVYDIDFGNGYYVACGYNSSGNAFQAVIWYSTDISGTWTNINLGQYLALQNIVFYDGKFAVGGYRSNGGESPKIMYASDPTASNNWTVKTVGNANNYGVYRLGYANGYWFAVSTYYNNGASTFYLHYSASLTGSWNTTTFTNSNSIYWIVRDIAFDGTNYILLIGNASNRNVAIYYSSDITASSNEWNVKSLDDTAVNGAQFIAAANGSLATVPISTKLFYISKNQLPVLTDSRVYHYIKAKE